MDFGSIVGFGPTGFPQGNSVGKKQQYQCNYCVRGEKWMSTFSTGGIFIACAVGLSLVAISVALFALWRERQSHQHRPLNRRILALETEVAVLTDEISKVVKLVQRRANREAVAASREKKKADSTTGDSDISDSEWVKRTNQQLTLRSR